MPRIGRRKTADDGQTSGSGESSGEVWSESERDALVERCLEVHAIIGEHGTPSMRRLIGLLLFEIGSEIGESLEDRHAGRNLN